MGMMQGTVMALSEPSRLLSDNHQDARPVLKHFQTIFFFANYFVYHCDCLFSLETKHFQTIIIILVLSIIMVPGPGN